MFHHEIQIRRKKTPSDNLGVMSTHVDPDTHSSPVDEGYRLVAAALRWFSPDKPHLTIFCYFVWLNTSNILVFSIHHRTENILNALSVTHRCAGIQISSITAISMTALLFLVYHSRWQPVAVFVTRIWFISFYIITAISFGSTLYEIALFAAGYQSAEAYRLFLISAACEMGIVYLIARRNRTYPVFDWVNLLCKNRMFIFHQSYLVQFGVYFFRFLGALFLPEIEVYRAIFIPVVYTSFFLSVFYLQVPTLYPLIVRKALKLIFVVFVLVLLTLAGFLVICERTVGSFRLSSERSVTVFRVTLACEATVGVLLLSRVIAKYGLRVIVTKLIGDDDLTIFNPAFYYKQRTPQPPPYSAESASTQIGEPHLNAMSDEPLLSPALSYSNK